MAAVPWRMKGKYLKNCNCAFGCPCDFNARPTHGNCTGMAGMRIEEGHFGEIRLDGLSWVALYRWPGALHEGNGTLQAVIDERADEAQRNALLTILSGREQSEGTFFHILSLIVTKMHEPLFLPIAFDVDLKKRTARVVVPGVLETSVEPIKNPVTGAPHRILIRMPEGFEYKEAEIASARAKGKGRIKFGFENAHSSLAHLDYGPDGPA